MLSRPDPKDNRFFLTNLLEFTIKMRIDIIIYGENVSNNRYCYIINLLGFCAYIFINTMDRIYDFSGVNQDAAVISAYVEDVIIEGRDRKNG